MRLPVSAKVYGVFVTLATLPLVAYVVPQLIHSWTASHYQLLVIFSVFIFLSQVYEIELVYRRAISTAIAFCLAAILLGGFSVAIAATLAGTLAAEAVLRWGRISREPLNFAWLISFNTSQSVIAAAIAYLIFVTLGGTPLIDYSSLPQGRLSFYGQIIPAVGAFVTFTLVNKLLVAGIIRLVRRTRLTYHLRFDLRYLFVESISLGVLGILLAVVYAQSPWNLLLVLIPLGLVHVSLRNYMKLRHEAKKTFEHLAQMLNARDPYTFEHSQEVADLAATAARQMGLHEDQIEQIRSAAVIHDIGKVGIPDSILKKPEKLSSHEWEKMKEHPDIGADLLKDIEIYADVVDIVRHEHEWWDGNGYPKGLRGEEIPIGARIVAIADSYHALTTDRPYRPAFSHEDALKIINRERGTHFDPQVVDAFFQVIEDFKRNQEEKKQEKMEHPSQEQGRTPRS